MITLQEMRWRLLFKKRVDQIKEDLSEGRVTEEHLLELLVEERNKPKHKGKSKNK